MSSDEEPWFVPCRRDMKSNGDELPKIVFVSKEDRESQRQRRRERHKHRRTCGDKESGQSDVQCTSVREPGRVPPLPDPSLFSDLMNSCEKNKHKTPARVKKKRTSINEIKKKEREILGDLFAVDSSDSDCCFLGVARKVEQLEENIHNSNKHVKERSNANHELKLKNSDDTHRKKRHKQDGKPDSVFSNASKSSHLSTVYSRPSSTQSVEGLYISENSNESQQIIKKKSRHASDQSSASESSFKLSHQSDNKSELSRSHSCTSQSSCKQCSSSEKKSRHSSGQSGVSDSSENSHPRVCRKSRQFSGPSHREQLIAECSSTFLIKSRHPSGCSQYGYVTSDRSPRHLNGTDFSRTYNAGGNDMPVLSLQQACGKENSVMMTESRQNDVKQRVADLSEQRKYGKDIKQGTLRDVHSSISSPLFTQNHCREMDKPADSSVADKSVSDVPCSSINLSLSINSGRDTGDIHCPSEGLVTNSDKPDTFQESITGISDSGKQRKASVGHAQVSVEKTLPERTLSEPGIVSKLNDSVNRHFMDIFSVDTKLENEAENVDIETVSDDNDPYAYNCVTYDRTNSSIVLKSVMECETTSDDTMNNDRSLKVTREKTFEVNIEEVKECVSDTGEGNSIKLTDHVQFEIISDDSESDVTEKVAGLNQKSVVVLEDISDCSDGSAGKGSNSDQRRIAVGFEKMDFEDISEDSDDDVAENIVEIDLEKTVSVVEAMHIENILDGPEEYSCENVDNKTAENVIEKVAKTEPEKAVPANANLQFEDISDGSDKDVAEGVLDVNKIDYIGQVKNTQYEDISDGSEKGGSETVIGKFSDISEDENNVSQILGPVGGNDYLGNSTLTADDSMPILERYDNSGYSSRSTLSILEKFSSWFEDLKAPTDQRQLPQEPLPDIEDEEYGEKNVNEFLDKNPSTSDNIFEKFSYVADETLTAPEHDVLPSTSGMQSSAQDGPKTYQELTDNELERFAAPSSSSTPKASRKRKIARKITRPKPSCAPSCSFGSQSRSRLDYHELSFDSQMDQLGLYLKDFLRLSDEKTSKPLLPEAQKNIVYGCEEDGILNLEHALDFLRHFSLKYAIPSDLCKEIMKSAFHSDSKVSYIREASQLLLNLNYSQGANIPVTWDEIESCLKTALNTTKDKTYKELLQASLELQLDVEILKTDLYTKDLGDARQLKRSMAYKMFAYDLSTGSRKSLMFYLNQVLHAGQNRGHQEESPSLPDILLLLQDLFTLCVDVSSSCIDCSNSLAQDILNTYKFLPSITDKQRLIGSFTSPLLQCKVVLHILESHYDNCSMVDGAFPDSLAEIVVSCFQVMPFRNSFTPPTTPTDDPEMPQAISAFTSEHTEEIVFLLYYLVSGYLQASNDKLHLALRLRARMSDCQKRLKSEDIEELGRFENHVAELESHLLGLNPELTPTAEFYLAMMRELGDHSK